MMKSALHRILIATLALAALPARAFDWPGGTFTVSVTCRGTEVFAGFRPSSPWGSTAFLNDPVLELRDAGNALVAQRSIGGVAVDWFDGGVRSATVSFDVPAGSYTLVGRDGTRHVRFASDGWSGFRLAFDPIADPVPSNAAPTVQWLTAPGSVGSGQGYQVLARGRDADGNLAQVTVWRDGVSFAGAGGGNGFESDAGNAASDAGPLTVMYTAQAVDAAGAASGVISMGVTVAAPAQFTLVTSAGPGGTVSPGGTFTTGTLVNVFPFPDGSHDFAGWSGDAGGGAVPLSVLVDRDKAVTANFSLKSFTLVTSVVGGGSVTPGGLYPIGTTVTLTAQPDAWHYFAGWSGDAAGGLPVAPVLVDRAKTVVAQFSPKAAQTIDLTDPGDQTVGAILPLAASSSSGLPVSLSLVSGPASWDGSILTVTGPGPIVVRASQPGDAFTLPAPAATVTFNAVTAIASITYQPAARTLLQQGRGNEGVNYVLERP